PLSRRPPIPPLLPYTPLFRSARASSEAGPGQRDRDDAHPVDVLRLAIGALHAEGCDLSAQFECDVRHPPTVVQDERPRDAHSRPARKSTRLNSSHVKISYAVF